MQRSFLYLLCVLLCLVSTTNVGSKASSQKQFSIGRLPREKNEPIRIRAVRVKGQKIRSNEKFGSNGDWLDNLTITIKNRTTKTILFASIDLLFSAPRGSDGPPAIDHLEFGDRSLMARSATPEESRSGIPPGQEVDIALTGIAQNRLRAFLTELDYLRTERILLKIGMVIFADDSSWYGDEFKRDPQSPSNWVRTQAPVLGASRARTRQPKALIRQSNFAPYSEVVPKGLPYVPGFSSPDFSSFPQLESLLVRTTYVATPQTSQCYKKDTPGITICSFTMSCHAQRDRTDMTPGGYQFITGEASCTNSMGDHCGTRSSSIAIPCVYGGGGGGGGGGGNLEDFNNGYGEECSSDWDCDFGYSCDWGTYTCQ